MCIRDSRYGASVGKVFWGKDGAYNVALIRLHNDYGSYIPGFLFLLMKSPLGQRLFSGISRSAQAGFKKGDIEGKLLPVLSGEEQSRIVAKVDELMVLCDQLDQQQEAGIAAHQTLVQTLLDALTTASERDGFTAAWTRIADHFDTLFTTEWSIEQLKQTILQLAVVGKLVPQDASDETTGAFLKKNFSERKKLVEEKRISKPKKVPPIEAEEVPFELPKSWQCLRFADLAYEVATGPFGTMVHKTDYIDGGVPLINPSHMIGGRIVEDLTVSVGKDKAKELSSYRLREGDVLMARRGEMGRCALVTSREDGWLCGTGSFVLRFHENLCREFVLLVFSTRWVKNYLRGKSVGATMTNLNHGILNRMPFCLPPVAEQHRIVAEVNKLLVLCENLKMVIRDAQATQYLLADAVAEHSIDN